jgi:hypothetical protein
MVMGLNVLRILPLSLLLIGCGSIRAGAPSKAQTAKGNDRGLTIEWLRTEIDHLRRLPESESYEPQNWRKHEVSSLAGMTRSSLVEALGPPDVCPRRDGKPCGFAPGRVVVYALFHLSSGSIGGGPNLIIHLDDAEVCTDAYLLGTK